MFMAKESPATYTTTTVQVACQPPAAILLAIHLTPSILTPSGQRFVVRRDWNFAKSGKPAAICQKLYRSEDPAKRS
jgi:hypothetical protein